MSREGTLDFKKAYAKAVRQSLLILGKDSADSIRTFLEHQYSTRLEETVDDPQLLADALESAIDGASKVIERQIIRLLYENIDANPPFVMTVDFATRIVEMREEYRAHERKSAKSRRLR